jgi:hypothetical protein
MTRMYSLNLILQRLAMFKILVRPRKRAALGPPLILSSINRKHSRLSLHQTRNLVPAQNPAL